jgi:hypothetical protein
MLTNLSTVRCTENFLEAAVTHCGCGFRCWLGRETQREVWSAHPSKSQGGKFFYFNRLTGQKSWSVPPGLRDPPWYPQQQQQPPPQAAAAGAANDGTAPGVGSSPIGAESVSRSSSASSEPLGGLNKSGEEMRADAHNCVGVPH